LHTHDADEFAGGFVFGGEETVAVAVMRGSIAENGLFCEFGCQWSEEESVGDTPALRTWVVGERRARNVPEELFRLLEEG